MAPTHPLVSCGRAQSLLPCTVHFTHLAGQVWGVSHIKVELIQSTGQTYTNNKQQCFSDKRDGHLFIWGSYFLEIAIFVFAWSLVLLFFLLEQLKLSLLMLHPSETALLYTSPRTTPQAVSFVHLLWSWQWRYSFLLHTGYVVHPVGVCFKHTVMPFLHKSIP